MNTAVADTRHLTNGAVAALPAFGPGMIALVLRVGLGLVMFSGGLHKLFQAYDPARQAAFVERYLSAEGYISQFWVSYLFEGALGTVLTPLLFLTVLSGFEFLCGMLLIAGVLVRPLALIWALLFWSFVAALPVVTARGAEIAAATHETPALLVMIRDIGLSGLFFVLFNIGAGRYSLDERLFGASATRSSLHYDPLGLLLRLSVALPLLVGGAFAGYGHIQTFGVPAPVLIALALPLLLNVGVRFAGVGIMALMLWFSFQSFDLGRSLIANMNAFKREFAFFAVGLVLALVGGGRSFSILRIREGWQNLIRPGRAVALPGREVSSTTRGSRV